MELSTRNEKACKKKISDTDYFAKGKPACIESFPASNKIFHYCLVGGKRREDGEEFQVIAVTKVASES